MSAKLKKQLSNCVPDTCPNCKKQQFVFYLACKVVLSKDTNTLKAFGESTLQHHPTCKNCSWVFYQE